MPKYSRAPITEAVINIRVVPETAISLNVLETLARAESGIYPSRTELLEIETEVKAGAQVATRATQTRVGVGFSRSDRRFIAQYRVDGFICSRICEPEMPYESWEEFSAEARRLWARYRAGIGNFEVSRVAVRYINRLDLPTGHDMREFVRAYPEVPARLPQQLAGCFMQVVLPRIGEGSTLILNEAFVPSPKPNHVGLILDVDLFRETALEGSDVALWAELEGLRAQKNEVFEACITPLTQEMIR